MEGEGLLPARCALCGGGRVITCKVCTIWRGKGYYLQGVHYVEGEGLLPASIDL